MPSGPMNGGLVRATSPPCGRFDVYDLGAEAGEHERAYGPASATVRSSTRMPSRGRGLEGVIVVSWVKIGGRKCPFGSIRSIQFVNGAPVRSNRPVWHLPRQRMVPPSTSISAPVTYAPALEAR